MKIILSLLVTMILISGCARNIPNLEQRKVTAFSISEKKNLKQQSYETKEFNLYSFQTNLHECKNINVYIEGDGLSWISRSRISSNPTPLNPIALKLMQVDNSNCKVYLARPCQYVSSQNCEKKYWTSHRFNHKIIDSFQETLNQIKSTNKSKTFVLVGFSGGGAIATIIASKRNDIKQLVTVSGNLDTKEWTDLHNISPLYGSLNPADYTMELKDIKQYHLIGKNDRIIPKDIFLSYQSNFSNTSNIEYKIYNSSHTKNWEQNYGDFLKEQNGN